MGTLYEITGDMLTLQDMLEELALMEQDDNVEPSELAEQTRLVTDTLEGVKGELDAKAEGYIAICNEFKAQAQIFKQERDKWNLKMKVAENAQKRLEQALFNAMIALGMDDKYGLDTGYHTLKIVGNGGAQPLEVTDVIDDIPEDFIRIKREADKKAIGEYLKSLPEDVEVSWAKLLPRGRHLSIK